MKRDMDLVRSILADVADSKKSLEARVLVDDEHDIDEINYHIDLLVGAGLVNGFVGRGGSGAIVNARIDSLTWDGNDFLDAVADAGVWSRVKKTVGKTVGAASFETIKALAVKYGTDALMAIG